MFLTFSLHSGGSSSGKVPIIDSKAFTHVYIQISAYFEVPYHGWQLKPNPRKTELLFILVDASLSQDLVIALDSSQINFLALYATLGRPYTINRTFHLTI